MINKGEPHFKARKCGCSVDWLSLELAKLRTRVQIPTAAPLIFESGILTIAHYRVTIPAPFRRQCDEGGLVGLQVYFTLFQEGRLSLIAATSSLPAVSALPSSFGR